MDRQLRLTINSNHTIEQRVINQDGTITPISLKTLNRQLQVLIQYYKTNLFNKS